MTHRLAMNPLSCTEAHPDHFDPTKFGRDGEPIGPVDKPRGRPGRPRLVSREVAGQIFALLADPKNAAAIGKLFDDAGMPKSVEARRNMLYRIRKEFGG